MYLSFSRSERVRHFSEKCTERIRDYSLPGCRSSRRGRGGGMNIQLYQIFWKKTPMNSRKFWFIFLGGGGASPLSNVLSMSWPETVLFHRKSIKSCRSDLGNCNLSKCRAGVCMVCIAWNNNTAFLSASRNILCKQRTRHLHMVHVTNNTLTLPSEIHTSLIYENVSMNWNTTQIRKLAVGYYLLFTKCVLFVCNVFRWPFQSHITLLPPNHTRKFHCTVFRHHLDFQNDSWIVLTQPLNCKRHFICVFRYPKGIPNHIMGHISLFTSSPQQWRKKNRVPMVFPQGLAAGHFGVLFSHTSHVLFVSPAFIVDINQDRVAGSLLSER